METWKPRPLCKRDCGKIRNGKHLETAQQLPNGKKVDWGDGYISHKQDELYKIPTDLISDIFVCLFVCVIGKMVQAKPRGKAVQAKPCGKAFQAKPCGKAVQVKPYV